MAKLSDLFGRKSGEADKFPSRLGDKRGNGDGDHINIENFSDIGSRMGEENEVLRNLLTDTGRKIGELDELKEAFDKIVAPFNSTLRALEREKSQTLGLSGMLEESRAAYETLRTEFYQIERKATTLEAESEKLREDLELSRESNRGLESTRLELSNDISTRVAQITELERQLAQETAQRRALSESRRTLQDPVRCWRQAQRRTRERACRRARKAGAVGRREALAAIGDRSGAQRDRPPHPPPHREREHPHRDPRPARQGRDELRGSLCRTRPPRCRPR
jgi:chromosome segregation ATPase